MQKKVVEDPSPETVVIVAFGDHQDSGKNFQKAIKDQNFHEFDVRQWLQRDPSVTVLHSENGEYQSTQRCVLQQSGFADLEKQLIDATWTNGKIAVYCSAGIHRSDVAGRMLEDVLNGIHDINGLRCFNAKYFALSSVPYKMHLQVIEDARQWYSSPWAVMPAAHKSIEERYAYSAAMSSKVAWTSWQEVHTYAGEIYKNFDLRVHHAKNRGDDGGDAATASSASSSPAAAPPVSASRPATPPKAAAAGIDDDSDDIMFKPPAKKLRTSDSGTPTWATVNRDVTVWYQVLEDLKCDKTACQTLFLLGQHSDDGYRSANAIIGKILKKQAEGHPVRNVSAFVHQCSLNARNAMTGGWGIKCAEPQ